MLAEKYGAFVAQGGLLSPSQYMPIPRAEARERWAALPERLTGPWLRFAREHEPFAWPALPASKYAAHAREGDLLAYLHPHWERRSILGAFVAAECIEGQGRYLDRIMDGIFAVCEETTWVVPHHNTAMRKLEGESLPDGSDREVELASSETGALLAWTCYLLGGKLNETSERIVRRIRQEVKTRLIEPYLRRDDYWWMGFVPAAHVNNWNPWCNNNMLSVFLLLEEDKETQSRGVAKIMRSLDEFLRRYPRDGCCEEGPMYWGAAGGGLFRCLEMLYLASGGKIDLFGDEHVRDIGRFIYRAHIDGDYFVDFADGDARFAPGFAPYLFGKRIGDPRLEQLGSAASPAGPRLLNWFDARAAVEGLFLAAGLYGEDGQGERKERQAAAETGASHIREAWLPCSQVMTARETEGTAEGLFLAAKGGSNAEPHNHNDVGSFIVYADGKPALIDLGTENYRAQTFSDRRYELWYLKSSYHNLPAPSGIVQSFGESYRAERVSCSLTDEASELDMEIAGAYPAEAGLRSWRRICRLVRGAGARIEIVDDYAFGSAPGELCFSLMAACAPDRTEPGCIRLPYAPGKSLSIRYDGDALRVRIEEIPLSDSRLRGNWGERVWRLLLEEKRPEAAAVRKLTVTIDR